MNIAKMMHQAQQMQKDMQSAQEELSQREVEASVGGGKVTVKATCSGDVTQIRISPDAVDPNDIELLEDLVLSGVRKAIETGKGQAAEEMSKLTGGLGLPPGMIG